MKQVSVAEILELPLQERIRLVELIWESIAAVPDAVEVTSELKADLEARLKDFEAHPEAGFSWEGVKAHLAMNECLHLRMSAVTASLQIRLSAADERHPHPLN